MVPRLIRIYFKYSTDSRIRKQKKIKIDQKKGFTSRLTSRRLNHTRMKLAACLLGGVMAVGAIQTAGFDKEKVRGRHAEAYCLETG
jgi:hypothetical protein